MDIKRKIKYKFKFKYFTLACLLMLLILAISMGIVLFFKNDIFSKVFLVFIGVFLFDMMLIHCYYKCFNLPDIANYELLREYLKYFSENQMSDLEYTEAVVWFSQLIRAEYLDKSETLDIFENTIYKLYLILRPKEGKICDAIKRKTAFIGITNKILNGEDFEKDIHNFSNIECEEYKYFKLLGDKNIIVYFFILIIHIAGCVILSWANETQPDYRILLGNLFFYLPSDILVILVYKGIVIEK